MQGQYSIVDIETTGGYRQGNKIIEIAIVNVDNGLVSQKYSSLINPELKIPSTITHLTGITNSMVEDAPKFFEIAKKVVELTQGRLFIAHNVFFDYNFIKHEFSELGFVFSRDKLCSVRLARKYLPGHKSYSLGKICSDLGIAINGRHRAMGDALATWELIQKVESNAPGAIENFSTLESKSLSLPPGLDRSEIEKLPPRVGIYSFFNAEGELLYIGKSKNIQNRIKSHFRPDMKRKKDIQLKNLIASIDYQETSFELAALLLECHQIKRDRPPFNSQYNRVRFSYGLTSHFDKDGMIQFTPGTEQAELRLKSRRLTGLTDHARALCCR